MKIGMFPLGNGGVAYYRMLLPMKKLCERYGASPQIYPGTGLNGYSAEQAEFVYGMSDTCDIIFMQRQFGRPWEDAIRYWQSQGKKVVYDLDDVYERIPILNLRPEYHIMNNRETLRSVARIINKVDAVTVSTKPLQRWVEGLKNNPLQRGNIHHLKNTLDFSMWPVPDFQSHIGKKPFVVGYAGSESHKIDLSELGGSLNMVKNKYGDQVMFGFFGFMLPEFWSLQPQVAFKVGTSFQDYPATLASLGFDIGLAPLKDCFFNTYKSELRILEYAALGIPTIASNIEPYAAMVDQCHDLGVLVNNNGRRWYSAIDADIQRNEEFRIEEGERGYRFVEQEYNLDSYVEEWYKVFSAL
jgi:glycosyltransferase involved in cell wall biosynthesis